jgi:outer membrane protein TolC
MRYSFGEMNCEAPSRHRLVAALAVVLLSFAILLPAQVDESGENGTGRLVNVRLGPYPSRAEADAVIERLQAEGVEFFLFPRRADDSWEISVGVFSNPENAANRMLRVEMLGIGPVRTVELERRQLEEPDEIPSSTLSTQPQTAEPPPPPVEMPPAQTEPSTSPPEAASLTPPPEELQPEVPQPEVSQPAVEARSTSSMPESDLVTGTGAVVSGEMTVMGLAEAVVYALDHSPELQERTLQIALRQSDVKRSWSFVQPQIDFLHTSTKIDPDTADRFNVLTDSVQAILDELGIGDDFMVPPLMYEESHRTRIRLQQNLFAGGGNVNRISAAKEGLAAAQWNREDREVELVATVEGAFFALTRQEHVVRLREESLARAQRFLDSIRRRFSLGLEARAEVLRWEVQVAAERTRLIQATNLMVVGLERFKRLIGYPAWNSLVLSWPDESEVDLRMAEGIAAAQYAAAGDPTWLDAHPAVIAANHALEAARKQRMVAKASYWPRLDLGGSVGYLENATLSLDELTQWSIALRLSLPLWHGGSRAADTSQALTEERLAELDLVILREDLFVSDRSLEADLRADLAELENATAAVEQAKVNLRIIGDKRELGLSGNIDLIDAQVVLTQSEVAKTSARFEFLIDLARWWRVRDPQRLLGRGRE